MTEHFERVFPDNKLTVGLITPLEAYPGSPFPTLRDHQTLAKKAEDAGFASIWVRDVPFYDPNFGDVIRPTVSLLSGKTRSKCSVTGLCLS